MVIVVLNSTVTMTNETTIIYLLVCLASSLHARAFVWTYARSVDRVMSQIITMPIFCGKQLKKESIQISDTPRSFLTS